VKALVSFPRQRPQNYLALVMLGNFFVCYVSGSVWDHPSQQVMFCMFGGSDIIYRTFFLFIFLALFFSSFPSFPCLFFLLFFSFLPIPLLFIFSFLLFIFLCWSLLPFLSRWCLILFTLYVNYYFFSFHLFLYFLAYIDWFYPTPILHFAFLNPCCIIDCRVYCYEICIFSRWDGQQSKK